LAKGSARGVQILLLDQIVDILLTIIIYYAVINLRGVSTNKTIIYLIAMQTYKELNTIFIIEKKYILNEVPLLYF
jgi:hypothetical protein